ncbi:hypothetical protein WAI453_003238 [Rhynchosporium graminicola]
MRRKEIEKIERKRKQRNSLAGKSLISEPIHSLISRRPSPKDWNPSTVHISNAPINYNPSTLVDCDNTLSASSILSEVEPVALRNVEFPSQYLGDQTITFT